MPDLLNDAPVTRRYAPPRPPRTPPPRPEPRRRSRVLKGISAALFAAVGGLLVVEAIALIIWMAEPRASAPLSAALRTGAAFWLLGHGGRLHLPAGTAALMPLGLTVLFAAFIARAGSNVAKARPSTLRRRTIIASALAVSVPYALTVALVAGISSGGGLEPSVVTALIGGFALALVSSAYGAARELPSPEPRPTRYRAIVAGLTAAALTLIAASALLAGLALITHISDAAALAKPAKAGAVGGLGLLALQVALAPNAVIWSATYLLGPGFSVGAGTLVSPTSAHLGDVPGLPMLASLPSNPGPWAVYLLFALPVAAGAIGGAVVIRRMPRIPTLPLAALLAAGVAFAVAGLAAGAAALSGGAVTKGRLATVGPSAWQNAIAAGLEIGIPCVLSALAVTWHRQRQVATTYAARSAGSLRERMRERFGRVGGFAHGGVQHAGHGVAALGGKVARFLHLPQRRKAGADVPEAPKVDLTHHGREPAPDPFSEPLTEPPTEPPTEPIPVVVAGPPPVDLVRHPKETEPEQAPAGVIAPALAHAAARAKRFVPRVPQRWRRRKVIKLPD